MTPEQERELAELRETVSVLALAVEYLGALVPFRAAPEISGPKTPAPPPDVVARFPEFGERWYRRDVGSPYADGLPARPPYGVAKTRKEDLAGADPDTWGPSK